MSRKLATKEETEHLKELEQLEELERKLVPILERRGISVEAIQPIGLIGRGEHSSVFSLLINHQYYVLKNYTRPDSFLREIRNLKKLTKPPEVALTSRHYENSLGTDIIVTKVPIGQEFNSESLSSRVCEHLADHLMELHKIKRRRHADPAMLEKRLKRYRKPVLEMCGQILPEKSAALTEVIDNAEAYLKKYPRRFDVQKSLIHNDLWWGNVIIATDEVYLVDWETVKTADYLEDIACLRVMLDHVRLDDNGHFWEGKREISKANRFFDWLIEFYEEKFDPNIKQRLYFYLVLVGCQKLKNYHVFLGDEQIRQRCVYLIEDIIYYGQNL